MEILRWKARIALLWVFMAVAMSVQGLFVFMEPGGIEKLLSEVEASGPGIFLFMTLFWLGPLWLAFVSMTVKDSCNRWINFVLGIVFTLCNIGRFFQTGVPLTEGGLFAEPTAHHILISGSTVVFTALIAWYAWKWPKQEA